jgi:hypothetical protein
VSRSFDPTSGADSITFSVGNSAPDQGPITIAVLAKAATTAGWTGRALRGLNGASPIWSLLTSNNGGAKLFMENDFGAGVAGLSTSWRWYVATKASGNVLPRIHVWDLSGAWSHTDNNANVGDGTGPIDTLVAGAGWRGSIAVAATWSSVLNDATIEATFGLSAAAVLAASPGWMARFNQASTATNVTDDTGGGGNQSAISGTTVDADDPPGFSYSLSNPSAAPNGVAVPLGIGTPTVALGLTAAPAGTAVPVTLGQPAAAIPAAVPTGVAVPVGLGQPTVGYILAAAPSGIAVPIHLGTPSTVLAPVTSAPGPTITTITRNRDLVTQSSGRDLEV